MTTIKKLGLFLTVSVYLVFGEEQKQDIYMQAAKCPYRFQMGCMLDVVEKNCGALQVIEQCAMKGKCKNMDGIERIVGALDPKNFEALNKCCCTKAFKEGGYEDCKNPNLVCKKALADHVDKDLKKHLKLLKKCMKKPSKTVCSEALASAKWVNEAVQKARGQMWNAEGCQMLAAPEPISACGWEVKPEPRAIERADLYCDTIIWQFKEMGASDHFMAQCKDAPAMPEKSQADEEEQGNEGEESEGNAMEQEQDDNDNLYVKAARCAHRKHMGCLLDVIDKSCKATRELINCINGSKCKKYETKQFLDSLDRDSKTFLLNCCCSGTMGYEGCKKKDSVCKNAVHKERPKRLMRYLKEIKAYAKKPTKVSAEEVLEMIEMIRDGLQRARGKMWKNRKCRMLAPMEPLIQCGGNSDEQTARRKDIFCDTMAWQFAELGIYNKDLSKCPGIPDLKPTDTLQEQGQTEELEEQDNIGDEFPTKKDEL